MPCGIYGALKNTSIQYLNPYLPGIVFKRDVDPRWIWHWGRSAYYIGLSSIQDIVFPFKRKPGVLAHWLRTATYSSGTINTVICMNRSSTFDRLSFTPNIVTQTESMGGTLCHRSWGQQYQSIYLIVQYPPTPVVSRFMLGAYTVPREVVRDVLSHNFRVETVFLPYKL